MHCLGWADTEHDSQNFRIGYPLSQRRVEASTTLLNKGKVKSRREGDRFEVGGGVTLLFTYQHQFWESPYDCPTFKPSELLGEIGKFGIEVGVVRVTAVPSPKTGINGELREVCEPYFPVDPVAVLPGIVRNSGPLRRSISAVEAPLEAK